MVAAVEVAAAAQWWRRQQRSGSGSSSGSAAAAVELAVVIVESRARVHRGHDRRNMASHDNLRMVRDRRR